MSRRSSTGSSRTGRRRGRLAGGRILHFDAFSGAAGNMVMGALLDAGLPRAELEAALEPLPVEFKLVVRKVERGALAARYVDVRVPGAAKPRGRAKRAGRGAAAARASGVERDPGHAHTHPHSHPHVHAEPRIHAPACDAAHAHGAAAGHGRSFVEIRDLIAAAKLPAPGQARALSIFEALGRAEARVHGVPLDAVHFHEVGAVDAIVDVCAAALALDLLEIEKVTCTPIALGSGRVQTAHGLLPVPPPATLELLKGIPTVPSTAAFETLTPTGAAILRTLVEAWGPMPAMTIEAIGYGAGNDRAAELPNVLRAVIGRDAAITSDRVACLETNLDDLVPEHFDYLMERLFEAGALDVSLSHIQMKKNRPGFLVRVLARPPERAQLARILFAESTAIGVRTSEWDRLVLPRESLRVETTYGRIRVKCVRGPDGSVDVSPEYDDCRKAARKSGAALREVVRAAETAGTEALAARR